MTEIVLSIVTSMLAVSLSAWRIGLGRRVTVRALSHLTGAGIERYYPQQRLAAGDLEKDLARAEWVKVLTGRGNELTRDTFLPAWRDAGRRIASVQILLPDPGPAATWLDRRADEISRYDDAYHPGLLHQQVTANIHYVASLAARRPGIAVRLFDLPHTCRTIVTDRVAYVTFYSSRRHGRTSPCFVFNAGSPMYAYAQRTFTLAWEAASRRTADPHRPGGADGEVVALGQA